MANEWINHPDLKNLDPIKLQLIRTAAANAGNKTGKDLAPQGRRVLECYYFI